MNHLTRTALPVPALGTAISDEGDAYVASLMIEINVDSTHTLTVDGTSFEMIMSAIRLRHLAFAPRTRALVAGEMKAASFTAAISRHWSSIDSMAEEPRLLEVAGTLETFTRDASAISWKQTN